ncbi:MAG TPA: CHASE2 domain-containing protein, partial [Stellaceae bacterium]|nr:CHASE2 domain-containing protein [Stellaceae bacterium]
MVAATIIVPLSVIDTGPLRILETASLDLRFRVRGPQAPGSEVAVILADDRSLARLGRWPLSRRLFADAVHVLERDHAKVIGFDLLFAEPERGLTDEFRESARAAASRLTDPQDAPLRSTLERLAADDPDAYFASVIRASRHVLLPISFSFTGPTQAQPPDYLSDQAYQQLDQSPVAPVFPLEPKSAVTPVRSLAEAASGIGHVDIPYDRDG